MGFNISQIINKFLPVQVVGSYNQYWPHGKLLFEDDFTDGLQGWSFLMENTAPVPGPIWTSRLSLHGTGSLLLQTGDALIADPNGFGIATAIKRMSIPYKEDGTVDPVIEFEAWFGWNSNDSNNPRAIQFGIDTQLPTRTDFRRYYKIRFMNYDDNQGARMCRWYASTPDPNAPTSGNAYFTEIPNTGGQTYWNEAKAGFFHVRFRINLLQEKYDTLWINGKKFDISSFAAPNDVYVGGSGGQQGFDNGMNFSFDLLNRLNTGTKKQSRLYVPYVRGTIV